jgi:hypothetical protein
VKHHPDVLDLIMTHDDFIKFCYMDEIVVWLVSFRISLVNHDVSIQVFQVPLVCALRFSFMCSTFLFPPFFFWKRFQTLYHSKSKTIDRIAHAVDNVDSRVLSFQKCTV